MRFPVPSLGIGPHPGSLRLPSPSTDCAHGGLLRWMRRKLSLFSPETARDRDEQHQHANAGHDKVTKDGDFFVDAANQNGADAGIAVDRRVSDEAKLPALDAPCERCAA